jgi:hypothetical protein
MRLAHGMSSVCRLHVIKTVVILFKIRQVMTKLEGLRNMFNEKFVTLPSISNHYRYILFLGIFLKRI